MAHTIKVTVTKEAKIDAEQIKDWCDRAGRTDGEEKAALFAEVSDRDDLFKSEEFEDLRILLEQIAEDDEDVDLDITHEVY